MEFRKLGPLLGIAPFALGALLFAGCGDDDDGGGGGTRTGTDEQFVSDFCAALKDFDEDFSSVFANIEDLEDEDAMMEAMAEPISNFANAFEDIRVPSDLRDWHQQASRALRDAADSIEDGNFDEAAFDEDLIEEPPQDVQDRLQSLAEDNEDCKDANFDFSD